MQLDQDLPVGVLLDINVCFCFIKCRLCVNLFVIPVRKLESPSCEAIPLDVRKILKISVKVRNNYMEGSGSATIK